MSDSASLEQLAQYAGPLLAYAWPLLQQAGVKLGENVVDKAADKGADKVFEYGKQLWDKLRGKPEAKVLEESVEQADGKPSGPALTAPLQQLLAADPQLATEIAALLEQAKAEPTIQQFWQQNIRTNVEVSGSGGAAVGEHLHFHGPTYFGGAPGAPGTAPAPTRIAPQLPDPVADFTGRKDQAGQLIARLRRREGAAITAIGGQGGVGKTELAYYVAREVRGLYPGGQVLVNLRGLDAEPVTPEQAMANVILAVEPEQKLPDKPEQIAGLYHGLLAERAVLVLADNAKDSEQVRPLVPKPPSALLVTSRQTVQLAGVERVSLDELPRPESVALLRAVLGDKPAEDGQLDSLAKVCGDLPLALRVAGNRLAASPALPVQEYLKRLEEKRAELRFEGRDVMAVLAESVEALERDAPAQVARWRSLTVFPAPFDRAAAEAVGEFDDGELDTLVGRSLVLYDAKDERFRLHDLMRDLAREGWSEEEAYNAATRQAAHYLTVLRRVGDAYRQGGEGVLDGLHRFDRERAHIEVGHAFAAAHVESDDRAATLAQDYRPAAWYVLELRQHPREKIRWVEATLKAARKLGNKRVETGALGDLGSAYADLGETRRAIGFFEQYLANTRELGNRAGEGTALGNLGTAYRHLGETRQAIEYHERHLAIARETDDRRGEGIVLGNLGNAYYQLGETRRAIEYYEQHLAIARETGDRRGEGQALGNLGLAYAALGETRRAIDYDEQHLAIARETGDQRGEGIALGNMSNAYADLGETRRAIESYEQVLAIARETGDRRDEGTALFNMSLALDKLGERAKAVGHARGALAIREQIEDPNAAKVRRQLEEWGDS